MPEFSRSQEDAVTVLNVRAIALMLGLSLAAHLRETSAPSIPADLDEALDQACEEWTRLAVPALASTVAELRAASVADHVDHGEHTDPVPGFEALQPPAPGDHPTTYVPPAPTDATDGPPPAGGVLPGSEGQTDPGSPGQVSPGAEGQQAPAAPLDVDVDTSGEAPAADLAS
jgi:hypothetical protein